MNIQPYILKDIEMCSVNEKIKDLKSQFEKLVVSHLPIEKEGVFQGCVSEYDIHTFEPEKTIADYLYVLEGFFVRDTESWLDVLDSFAQNQTNFLPVLDAANTYVGYVELNEIINLFTETPFLSSPGGVFVVEKGYKDISFSEISQIVESNGAHLLGAFISKMEDDMVQVTIKTGQTVMNTILQSFRRYGYKVISHHQEDTFKSNLRERSDYLDKYLNI